MRERESDRERELGVREFWGREKERNWFYKEEREMAVANGGGGISLEGPREEKKRKEKKRKRKEFKGIKILLFNSAQNSISSERYPKSTENREYYPET